MGYNLGDASGEIFDALSIGISKISDINASILRAGIL